ncbi:MAG: PAS domain S-box protein, partial [Deltaproteobacteria bacterium]|nr:PAS domain S-box protein [Deltaproteobacteria bacterium]
MNTEHDDDPGRVRAAFPESNHSGLVPRANVPGASPIPRESVHSALRAPEAAGNEDAETVPGAGALVSPRADQVTAELLTLAAETNAEMSAAQLTTAYRDALYRLFPGRQFCIELAPRSVPSPGAQQPPEGQGRECAPLSLSRGALERHQRAIEDLDLEGITLTDEYVPRFAPEAVGIDVPLFDRKRVAGVLSVEYPPEIFAVETDATIVIPFALQLAGLLRSARLLAESTYYREYLEKLIEHANAPIIVIGRHRKVRGANRTFATLMGMSPVELEGRDIFDLVPPEERARLLPVLIDALRGEPTSDFELQLSPRSGGRVRIVINAASILTAGGEVEAVIAIGSDRTEVRELEEMVIQSEKMATLGELAASVVHELNNPLTSISVYGNYLMKVLRTSGAAAGDVEKARRIVDASDRILSFTKDLMNYARPADAEPATVHLRQVLDDSLVFCEHLFDRKGIVVERVYADEQPRVFGVIGQLHQVFINLFTNASHAIPETGGLIRVTTHQIADGEVVIEVSDNGKGISAQRLDKVFDPFFTTKTTDTGTGLGLSVVRSIV